MRELEPEEGSIYGFIYQAVREKVDNIKVYYDELQEGFLRPSLYFPTPEVETHGYSTSSFLLDYTCYIKCFEGSQSQAQEMALTAIKAIRAARNLIPLKWDTGTLASAEQQKPIYVRVRDPEIKPIETDVYQITIRWTKRMPYNSAIENYPQAGNINITGI